MCYVLPVSTRLELSRIVGLIGVKSNGESQDRHYGENLSKMSKCRETSKRPGFFLAGLQSIVEARLQRPGQHQDFQFAKCEGSLKIAGEKEGRDHLF
jgi:hypothetical protein